jgi:hypothetical protein
VLNFHPRQTDPTDQLQQFGLNPRDWSLQLSVSGQLNFQYQGDPDLRLTGTVDPSGLLTLEMAEL